MPDHRGLRCRIHVNQCVLSSDNKRSAKLGSGEVDFDIALKIMKMYFCRSYIRIPLALWRHSRGTLVALWRHSRGTVAALSRHYGGTLVALWRHSRGTVAALSRHYGGTLVALWRHPRGTVMALSWHCHGTLVFTACSACISRLTSEQLWIAVYVFVEDEDF